MRDKPLLCMGIIDCVFKICLALFKFVWTPLLEESANSIVHPGAIFICFMTSKLIGTELFQASRLILNTNSIVILLFTTLTCAASFFLAYFVPSFTWRLIFFIYFEV